MNTQDVYQKVAEHCSAYTEKKNCCSNKSGDDAISCTTCKHFTSSNYCDIDLLDPIVENHDF